MYYCCVPALGLIPTAWLILYLIATRDQSFVQWIAAIRTAKSRHYVDFRDDE
jgi:hypothetical protein